MVNDLLTALDDDEISVLLLLDLSAAFDTRFSSLSLSSRYSLWHLSSVPLHSYGFTFSLTLELSLFLLTTRHRPLLHHFSVEFLKGQC